jgi:hypothetical protein
VTTVIDSTAGTARAAVMVSTSIASTTRSRASPPNSDPSLLLAASRRLTAMISPTPTAAILPAPP